MDLKGKVAIVTGAARGIGRGITLELAKEGMRLGLVDLRKSQIKPVLDEIKKFRTKAIAIETDVTSVKATKRMAKETIDAFGQIDVLVNNAGVIIMAPFTDKLTYENWDKIFNVNIKGQLLCTQAVMPCMIERKNGRIVNLASIGGVRPQTRFLSYCLSKIAVIGLTQVLAKGLGEHNITVNAICPGFIETDMWKDHLNPVLAPLMGVSPDKVVETYSLGNTLLKRPQTSEDIAKAVAFLCQADSITGVALNVSGGYELMDPS
jgi:NAD(P)-dependent dehydrogenase (short-subunit alcohol dehydrogenase family)